jgi:thymidine phosphorylase
VQAGAGVVLHAKPGDRVRAGQPLLTLHTDTPERFDRALSALTDVDGAGTAAWVIGEGTDQAVAGSPDPAGPADIVLDRVSS